MLDDYINTQPIVYNIFKHQIANNIIGHAYLIYSAKSDMASSFAFSLAKTLICPNHKTKNSNCNKCNLCQRINNNNFPELVILEPDGLWIKKDQLTNLQEKFKMRSLEGTKRIYIINSAEKLNMQSANSILKFLEEPEEDIIAILATNDLQSILPTIISRCQIINLQDVSSQNNDFVTEDCTDNRTLTKIAKYYCSSNEDVTLFVNEKENLLKIEAIVSFINYYEKNKIAILANTKSLWHNYFFTKEDNIFAFELMELFYKDVLNNKFNRNLDFFINYNDTIDFVTEGNSQNQIINKIKKILLLKEKIKYNINLNLLIDKLILDMEGDDLI